VSRRLLQTIIASLLLLAPGIAPHVHAGAGAAQEAALQAPAQTDRGHPDALQHDRAGCQLCRVSKELRSGLGSALPRAVQASPAGGPSWPSACCARLTVASFPAPAGPRAPPLSPFA